VTTYRTAERNTNRYEKTAQTVDDADINITAGSRRARRNRKVDGQLLQSPVS